MLSVHPFQINVTFTNDQELWVLLWMKFIFQSRRWSVRFFVWLDQSTQFSIFTINFYVNDVMAKNLCVKYSGECGSLRVQATYSLIMHSRAKCLVIDYRLENKFCFCFNSATGNVKEL